MLRCTIVCLALAVLAQPPQPSQPSQRRMAVTIDDLPTASVLGNDIEAARRTTTMLVGGVKRNAVPAIGFVNGERKLQPGGQVDKRRVALLEQWLEAGLELGNHTYAHHDLHIVPVEQFEKEVLEGERATWLSPAARGRRLEFFRHPFLHTGRTLAIKTRFEAFLRRMAIASLPSLWTTTTTCSLPPTTASVPGDAAAQQRVADAYIEYMDAVIAFYEDQAVKIVGRDIATPAAACQRAQRRDVRSSG